MNTTADSGLGTIKCDPSLENCAASNTTIPGITDITNVTNGTNSSTTGIFAMAVQYNLLAVGGIQALAGYTTFLGSDSGAGMSFINSAFGTLGVFFGLQQFFFKDVDQGILGNLQDYI